MSQLWSLKAVGWGQILVLTYKQDASLPDGEFIQMDPYNKDFKVHTGYGGVGGTTQEAVNGEKGADRRKWMKQNPRRNR